MNFTESEKQEVTTVPSRLDDRLGDGIFGFGRYGFDSALDFGLTGLEMLGEDCYVEEGSSIEEERFPTTEA